jgi:hypothetical protein
MPEGIDTTVFKFGIGRTPSGETRELLMGAMGESHRLKNRLIQLERARREAIRSIQSRHPVIGPLTAEYERQRGLRTALGQEIASKHQAELNVINAQIAAASTADLVKSRKALERRIKKAISESTEHITTRMKELAEELRQAKTQHKDELTAQYESVTAEVKPFQDAAMNEQTEEEAAEFGYDAHAEGHVYTRWWTLENQQDSFKKRVKDMSPSNDPQFLRFRSGYLTNTIREGTICAGINQTKKDCAGTLAMLNNPNKGKLCVLQAPPAAAYDPKVPRSHRKLLQRTKVLFRIGNIKNPTGGRMLPHWAELEDVIFHRQIPADAMIVEALVKLEAVGAREKWFLILTLQMPRRNPIAPATTTPVFIRQNTRVLDGRLQYADLTTPTASIPLVLDINPRSKVRRFKRFGPEADGTTVWGGYKRNERGELRRFHDGEFVPGDRHIQNIYDYQEYISGKIDSNFNLLILGKTEREDEHLFCVMDYIQGPNRLPKPLLDAKVDNVHKWRSQSRFQKLYRAWRDNRVEGDEAAFDLMYRWAYQDLHLYQWARDMTARAVQRKRDHFRVKANEICRRYGVIYIDSRTLTKKDLAGIENQEASSTIQKWRNRASFATFREVLRSTAKRLGVPIHEVDPAESLRGRIAEFARRR